MSSPVQHPPQHENKILATLNPADDHDLLSKLQRVSLNQGEVVYEADRPISHVYFPGTAVFSLLATMEDGSTAEVGPVGNEGMVGLRVFLGADKTLDRVIVHVAGSAMRLKASVLKTQLLAAHSGMPAKLSRYTQMLLAMTGQSGACNKLHKIEQQLARWLLMISDYVGDELKLTHELMGLTLGVRRASITEAANSLRDQGVIAYSRAHIRIVERNGLESLACECYRVIKAEYEALYADLEKKPDPG